MTMGFAPTVPTRAPAPVMESASDLKALASKLNPVVGYCKCSHHLTRTRPPR